MEGKLQKPVFTKVSTLQNSRDGYNVYVKVVSAEHSTNENQTFDMVRAVVADQTGCANAFFKGDNAKLIKKDGVIAIRNGKIRLVKDHISLQVDIFGRITQEKIDIKPNTTVNISEKQIRRRPRANRSPRRQGPRGQRNDRNERGERYERNDRNNYRNGGNDRNDRNEGGRRNEEGDRRPRRQDGERRPPRRQEGQRRKEYDGEDRPRRQDSNRPKIQWTKVGAIEPGDEGLNLIVKVISVQPFKNKCRVVIGDETGKVKGFFFQNEAIKEGNTIVIFRAQACVVKEHIEMQIPKGGKVQQSRSRKIAQVDESVDISEKEWVQSS